MFKDLSKSIKSYKKAYLKDDIVAGIIVAVLSIPVAMGYAQIAGLPAIYGLYASILPVLAYVLFSSSSRLIFGIDASSSAITGSILMAMGITFQSQEALVIVPLISFSTGLFMLLFSILKVGKFSNYIPTSVTSGFISGIGLAILISQIPKIMGIEGKGTEFVENVNVIIKNINNTNVLSLILGITTAVIIIIGKKKIPKVPLSLIILVIATTLSHFLKFGEQGVAIVGSVPQGLPELSLPKLFSSGNWQYIVFGGFITAIILSADSLLVSKSFGKKYKEDIDDNRELFAFGMSNLASSVSGGIPTSASVSRTAASEQFHGRTKLVSVVAVAVILIMIALLSRLLFYMPQPVLGGIVLAALYGVIESEIIEVFSSLYKYSKKEALIWSISLLGVLLIGVLFGVTLGIILSLVLIVVSRNSTVPSTFLGVIPDKPGYYSLDRNPKAKPIDGILIYRFVNSLYFVNIYKFVQDIENSVDKNTKAIIFDVSAMNDIDMTSVGELKTLLEFLDNNHIEYYFASSIGDFRDAMREKELGFILDNNLITKTIDEAVERVKNE